MLYKVLDVPEFSRTLLKLGRKYPSAIDIVDSFFEDLEAGTLKGVPVPRLKLKGDRVYKTRLDNPDANKGTKGGFRIIYYLVTSENEIYPLTIYSKSDTEDISPKEIMRMVQSYIKKV